MAEGFNTEDMLDVYLFENQQLLERLQEIVLEHKDDDCFDEDSINEIFRAMHTIKGSSGMMMFDDVTAVAHKLEDVFYYLRESKPTNVPHIKLVEHVLEVTDFISGEMEKLQDGGKADGDASGIIASIDEFLKSIQNGTGEEDKKSEPKDEAKAPMQFYIAPMATSASHFYKIYLTYTPGIPLANIHAYKVVFDLKEIAEELMYYPEDIMTNEASADEILENGFKMLLQTQSTKAELEEIIKPGYELSKVDIIECSAVDFQKGFDSFGTEIRIDLESSVEEIQKKVSEGDEHPKDEIKQEKPVKEIAPGDFVIEQKSPGKTKQLAKDKPKKVDKTTFISVDVAKMDMLMDLIGELVISESVVLQNPDLKVPGLRLDNFRKAAGQMTKIATNLQNVIMSMRMVPLTATFQKMNRIVFDVSRKLDKDVEFEMIGDTTEVDKNIIEHISDPLMHLVRNSLDHGIESRQEREKAGKTEKGRVTLSARNESGKVFISVADNGAGLDREKILAKARRQGIADMYKPDSAFSDKEVYQFITLPGFSTNEKVTEYSGRGVGMDVVVSNLQSIGGSLEIESTPGKGSTMTMIIPLTLAIIDGIVLKDGDSLFVIETGMVKEFISARDNRIIKKPDGEEFIMIRGQAYPVIRLTQAFDIHKTSSDERDGMFVMIEVDRKVICLVVDKLLFKQEIVVKPIPEYIKKVKGLSGCTQLGDGSIALILDPAGLTQ
jgi:two-component system chemotaxis sensor kinase CheA